MNQSAFIAGALLAGFVLYVAAKGRLNVYTAVLWGPTAAPAPGASGGSAIPGVPSVAGAVGSVLGPDAGKIAGNIFDSLIPEAAIVGL